MFIPAFIEKEKKKQENRLEIPKYTEQYEEFLKNKINKEEKKETVIHIQIY